MIIHTNLLGDMEILEANDCIVSIEVLKKLNKTDKKLTLKNLDSKLLPKNIEITYNKNEAHSPLLLKAIQQLQEYFLGQRKNFDIPIKLNGTDFQLKVWREMQKTPYGEVISYDELAKRINHPKAVRAVGGACGKNPIPIIVPCHRVIGKNGKLVGFGGGIDYKEKLLILEKTYS